MVLHKLISSIITSQNNNKLVTKIHYSKKSIALLQLLYKKSIIRGFSINKDKSNILVYLKYRDTNKPLIKYFFQTATSKKPIYVKFKEMKSIHIGKQNQIYFLLQTSKGLCLTPLKYAQSSGGSLIGKLILNRSV